MAVFEDYAELYDLFYQDKSYSAECGDVMGLVKKHSSHPVESILDLGCGTGGHALEWAKEGFHVSGLDRSQAMLSKARNKAEKLNLKVSFFEGDIRNFDLGQTFDSVTAMFAVMSYQTKTEDVLSAFNSVNRHLKSGGLFVFDVWFGPGVISDPPGDRVKSFEKDGMEILRTVQADHNLERHVVTVNYDILCIRDNIIVKRIREKHDMRYFFPKEITDYASSCGFEVLASKAFVGEDEALKIKDWNATFVLRKI